MPDNEQRSEFILSLRQYLFLTAIVVLFSSFLISYSKNGRVSETDDDANLFKTYFLKPTIAPLDNPQAPTIFKSW